MTPQRFRALIEAYGAEPRRWPATERTAAKQLLTERSPEIVRALAEAVRLDEILASHVVAPASDSLERRILTAAPEPRASVLRIPLWWSGAGFAGVGLAGALVGGLVVAHLAPPPTPPTASEWSFSATAFGEIDGQDE